MSLDALYAAQMSQKKGHARSAASRAYYAAYSALAGEFEPTRKYEFAYEQNNPGHDQLLALTANNLDRKKFNLHERRTLKRCLRMLQTLRIRADYNPADSAMDMEQSLIAIRQATKALLVLGVLR
jgi:hypothetical protein